MRIGTGSRVVNPEAGHPLAGYAPDPNEGVHDDILVRALYLHDGAGDALLLTFDLVGMCMPLVDEVRAAVAARTGVDVSRVLLHCTHVHSGPEVRTTGGGEPKPSSDHMASYSPRLVAWAAEAAEDARLDAEECSLRHNFAQVPENMNRRFRFPDRSHRFIPNAKSLAGCSDEFLDREFGIVGFKRTGGKRTCKAVLTNYTAHPLCVGNSSRRISSDYQGVLRRTVEATFEDARCIATTGAAGDHHPLMPESGFAQAARMGETLGSVAICRIYDAARIENETRLRVAYEPITLRGRDGNADFHTAFSLLGIGPVVLAGMPGELVGCLGAQFKWSNPFLKGYLLMTATDSIGYIPSMNQYHWGGYEVGCSRVAPGEGERLVNAALEAAGRLVEDEPLAIGPPPA